MTAAVYGDHKTVNTVDGGEPYGLVADQLTKSGQMLFINNNVLTCADGLE